MATGGLLRSTKISNAAAAVNPATSDTVTVTGCGPSCCSVGVQPMRPVTGSTTMPPGRSVNAKRNVSPGSGSEACTWTVSATPGRPPRSGNEPSSGAWLSATTLTPNASVSNCPDRSLARTTTGLLPISAVAGSHSTSPEAGSMVICDGAWSSENVTASPGSGSGAVTVSANGSATRIVSPAMGSISGAPDGSTTWTPNVSVLASPARSSTRTVTELAPTWACVGVHAIVPSRSRIVMPAGASTSEKLNPAWFTGSAVSTSMTNERPANQAGLSFSLVDA